MRKPLNTESLRQLNLLLPSPIDAIIDVGVQYSTPFLMECFPEAFHYLIEPVVIYHGSIRNNYIKAGIKFNLIEAAASDVEGVLFQHLQCLDDSGTITHSQLLDAANNNLQGLVRIDNTPVITLDSTFKDLSNYLVKIDVDGIEEKIIRGGVKTIRGASVVIIEATLGSLISRASLLKSMGMNLFDITDMCYYYGQLQQVDLIFVNSSVSKGDLSFQPLVKYSPIVWAEWHKYGLSS
jgi:FkbM family methyltransferase